MNRLQSTYFGLLAEFGAAEVPLEDCCKKYFGLDVTQAKRRAGTYSLPVKAYRATASQKGGWLVSMADLAEHIDKQKAEAERMFRAMSSDSPDEGLCTSSKFPRIHVA
jgi:hypothetical protein